MFAPNLNNTIREQNRDFTVIMTVDTFSKRTWVSEFNFVKPDRLVGFVFETARRYSLEKIIMPTEEQYAPQLISRGFNDEGFIDGYFAGAKARFLTAYSNPGRAESAELAEHLKLVEKILHQPQRQLGSMASGYDMVIPDYTDIQQMIKVYRRVFATYPSPVDQPEYLKAVLGKTALFRIVKKGSQIISVAAAEVDWQNRSAELTNCATLPEARGAGLMSQIIGQLERDCLDKGITCLYGLARASSFGMNLVFHRLGYRYGGVLINNCHISGKFENMNIWFKHFC